MSRNIESFWFEDDNLDVDVTDDILLFQQLCPEENNINCETVFIPKTEEDEWQSVELKVAEPKSQTNKSQSTTNEKENNNEKDDEERKVEILEQVIDKIVNDDPDDKKLDDFIPDPNKHTVKIYNPNNPLPFSGEINDMFKNALNELIDQYK